MRFLFLLLFLFTYSFLESNAEMAMNISHSVFVRSLNSAMVEFYYSYPESSYSLQNIEGKIARGNISFYIKIEHLGEVINELKWSAPFEKSFTETEVQEFYGLKNFELITGKYKVTFEAKDVYNDDNYFKKNFYIEVEKFIDSNLFIGGIQMANNIILKREDDNSNNYPILFFKNGYYVYPNPLMEISNNNPTLYLYSEIYNAKTLSPEGIDIKYTILDAKNKIELEHKKKRTVLADAFVETISIPLDAFASGVYYAEIKIFNNQGTDSSSKKIKFFLINNNIEITDKIIYTEDEMFEMSEFATYTEKKANDEFEKFSIVASNLEKKSWERLSDLKAKQRFLYRFWYIRNSEQKSTFNKELQTFRERLKYVTTYYSFGGKQNGWQTDRGKIYIKFGEPDQIDRNSATPSKRAYDVWYYTGIEGGGEFYFIDMHGMGIYNLVHSTAFGYIKNDNWYEIVTGQTNYNKY